MPHPGCHPGHQEEEGVMESSMKPVVLEDPPDAALNCCCPGCCALPCCKLCCLPCCSMCCPRCVQRCCCGGGGCGCSGCGGCARSCLCFLPRLLCYLPRKLLSCGRCRCLLLVVLAVLLLVIVVAGVLLLWLRVAPNADEALEGTLAWPWLPMRVRDEAATFYVDGGTGGPATVIYDYEHLLISYRSWRHPACYVTRMDGNNIQGLDDVTAAFERRQAERALAEPLADRSLLSTAANVLCSVLPVYWA